jgi:hypothetical protein
MLDSLARIDPADHATLENAITAHLRAVEEMNAPEPPSGQQLVELAENEASRAPAECFRFGADGHATLHAAGRTFQAGHFETPRIGELRQRAEDARRRAGNPSARLQLHVLDGASPATDIGTLQATAPDGTLFQVASQFNCLEAPSARMVPVAAYFYDGTQGPRASISAFPGTLLRHYAAPGGVDGERFVQRNEGPQLNLLEAVCAPGVATVTSGYLTTNAIAHPELFARSLEDRFDDLRSGVHDAVEVVLGYDWDGPVPRAPHHTIAQVLTSTLAAGGYGRIDPSNAAMTSVVRQLQRAAYAGTLLAAAGLGKSHAVLTLIGGGVFGNPIPLIWESILWAVDYVKPFLHRDLSVVVNGYALGRQVAPRTLYEAAAARGGTLVVFRDGGFAIGNPDEPPASQPQQKS